MCGGNVWQFVDAPPLTASSAGSRPGPVEVVATHREGAGRAARGEAARPAASSFTV
jgi:hypothetical protein